MAVAPLSACADRGSAAPTGTAPASASSSICDSISDGPRKLLEAQGKLERLQRQAGSAALTDCVWGSGDKINAVSLAEYGSAQEAHNPLNKRLGTGYRPVPEIVGVDEAYYIGDLGFLGGCNAKLVKGNRIVDIGYMPNAGYDDAACKRAVVSIAAEIASGYLQK